MAKFRKTAVMEATQYRVGGPVPDGVCLGECVNRDAVAHIHTLEGDLTVQDGDWVMTGVQGEHWAIKPDIFAATYESADVSPAPPATAETPQPPRGEQIGEGGIAQAVIRGIWTFTRILTETEHFALHDYIYSQGGGIDCGICNPSGRAETPQEKK